MPRVEGTYALLKESRVGEWFYVIRAANHQVLSGSEMYSSKTKARNAAVKAAGQGRVYERSGAGRPVLIQVA